MTNMTSLTRIPSHAHASAKANLVIMLQRSIVSCLEKIKFTI